MNRRVDCTCPRAQHTHGTRGAYQKDGCRCFDCRIGHSRIQASGLSGNGWSDGVYCHRAGTVRRLEALLAIGWSEREMGDWLGVTKQAVRELRVRPAVFILDTTADRVRALYDALWNQAPTGQYRARTKRWAAAQGFQPPLAWDDDDIDDPAGTPYEAEGGGRELKPCGTAAAARRHHRRGEPLCDACRNAERRDRAERRAA